MDEQHIYQKIVEAIHQDILNGVLQPGDKLPPIRQMTGIWGCSQGTVLRAYQELANEGLLVSRVGQGTRVVQKPSIQDQTPLRRAILFNKIEAYLLEIMTSGYTPDEVEQAMRMALEHWQIFTMAPLEPEAGQLLFVGSHDPAVVLIAAQCPKLISGCNLRLSFSGSLGGLIALAEHKADLAGSHLWDDEMDSYNRPFVHRLLPGQKVALVTLAHRRVGLMVPPGNPLHFGSLADLARPGLKFVNRQPGSGTRVWLDSKLKQMEIDTACILGYGNEKMTHSEVALAVAQVQADAGLGVQSAASSFGLDFVFLTTERYDLVIPEEKWSLPGIQALVSWLNTDEAKTSIDQMGGYEVGETGKIEWLE
jgi:molybdate-binding protein/DNA-binding transcriptional regulator YhcF (GntR family)